MAPSSRRVAPNPSSTSSPRVDRLGSALTEIRLSLVESQLACQLVPVGLVGYCVCPSSVGSTKCDAAQQWDGRGSALGSASRCNVGWGSSKNGVQEQRDLISLSLSERGAGVEGAVGVVYGVVGSRWACGRRSAGSCVQSIAQSWTTTTTVWLSGAR